MRSESERLMGLMGLVSLIWPMAMAEKAKKTEILNGILFGNRRVVGFQLKDPAGGERNAPTQRGACAAHCSIQELMAISSPPPMGVCYRLAAPTRGS